MQKLHEYFLQLYQYEDEVTYGLLAFYILLLIFQLLLAGKYIRKKVGKKRGVFPLLAGTVGIEAIVIGCGVIADRLPVRIGERDSTMWYGVFIITTAFFSVYIAVFILSIIFGRIRKWWVDWRKRRRKKRAEYVS